nr:MAG TPA: hypothetical protein [Caudoviricetes sp.]
MKVFRDYAEVNEKMMEGYTVTAVTTGINEHDTGMLLELERKVDNVTLGIDVTYNPDCGEDETPLMISDEYVKEQV